MLHINMNMIISISTTCYYTFAASIFINSIRKNFILFIIFHTTPYRLTTGNINHSHKVPP